VRRLRPAGPYRLGGWSLGALVALEMAERLARDGESASLVLIDPTTPTLSADGAPDGAAGPGPGDTPAGEAPGAPTEPVEPVEDDVRSVAFLAKDLAALAGAEAPVSEEELAAAPAEERLDLVLTRAAAAGLLPADAGPERLRRIATVYRSNARAAAAYRPAAGRLSGRAAAVFAEDSPAGEGLDAWRRLVGTELAVHRLPGDHYTLLQEPRVERLAAALGEWLAGTVAACAGEDDGGTR